MGNKEPVPALLNDDVVVEILSRLPAKSLLRCKCVSKRWLALISNEDHRKKLPLIMHGLFCNTWPRLGKKPFFASPSLDPAIDVSLSFLPPHYDLLIVDICNGMLLCRLMNIYPMSCTFCICNPVTAKWVTISIPHQECKFIALGFDPRISPHFSVICSLGSGELDFFSSRTGDWKYSTNLPFSLESRELSDWNIAFVNGLFHIFYGEKNHILAVDLEKHVYQEIELPGTGGRKIPGQSGGYLNFARITVEEIQIWMLMNYSQSEWMLKCRIKIVDVLEKLHIDCPYEGILGAIYLELFHNFAFEAFHPDVDVIFLRLGRILLAYHLNNAKSVKLIYPSLPDNVMQLRLMGNVMQLRFVENVMQLRFMVYSPCFIDAFGMENVRGM